LKAKKGRHKRNSIMTLFLLPVLIFIFLMGWSMYWIGGQKRPEKRAKKTRLKEPSKKDNVTFMPIILEEKPEITSD
jgi:Tfp pilus assembly protein PilO